MHIREWRAEYMLWKQDQKARRSAERRAGLDQAPDGGVEVDGVPASVPNPDLLRILDMIEART